MIQRAFSLLDPRPYISGVSVQTSLLLLLAAVLPALHYSFGSIAFAENTLHLARPDAVQYMFGAALLLFGVLPAVTVIIGGMKLRDLGVQLGDWRDGLSAVVVLYPLVLVATLLPGAYTPELQAFYPFNHEALNSWQALAHLELTRAVIYYFAWEFFFRGVLLFGLRKELGDWPAILIQVIPSCLSHLGMPTS